ncbi:MAG: sulfite exporter TauE/SafE family protein, partial [Gemmatimonadetes bacterium]|nr:sulfite exporter TauE/SafE family protein [Gemmatimonadota bacterium]
QLDRGAAAWIAAGLFVGAWGGALLGHRLSAPTLQRAFALLLVAVAARLWTSAMHP